MILSCLFYHFIWRWSRLSVEVILEYTRLTIIIAASIAVISIVVALLIACMLLILIHSFVWFRIRNHSLLLLWIIHRDKVSAHWNLCWYCLILLTVNVTKISRQAYWNIIGGYLWRDNLAVHVWLTVSLFLVQERQYTLTKIIKLFFRFLFINHVFELLFLKNGIRIIRIDSLLLVRGRHRW